MNQNQLNYFVAVAETQSFTKAAHQFYISQTAITQQIKLLEDSMGCALIDRGTRPVTLTPAGRVFLTEAKNILARMNHAAELVHDASIGMTGILRIGYVRGYERSDLSLHVQSFHADNPNILTTFHRNSTDALAAELLSREHDIIFTWDSTNIKENPEIEYRVVEQARLVVALYKRHPLALHSSLSRKELKGETIIYMSPSATSVSFGDEFFMNMYQDAGYTPHILFRTSDTESVLMMVASEEGISILPDYCVLKLYNADNLQFIPLTGDNEFEEIIMVWRKDNSNPALRRFVESFPFKN